MSLASFNRRVGVKDRKRDDELYREAIPVSFPADIHPFSLSSQRQFRSKEISKSSVVDDMVAANPILFKTAKDLTEETGEVHKKGEHPDHIVVIKHVPAVGDSSEFKRPEPVVALARVALPVGRLMGKTS